jgi:UDP-N-acetylmuramate dehydrogenase
LKIGGAFVSEKHANFLMNDGSATLQDVLDLCLSIQDKVERQFGLRIEREVQLVGEKGVL